MPFHKKRAWSIRKWEGDAESLAAHLLEVTSWTLCYGVQFEHAIWVNDSTNEDALMEFAVLRPLQYLGENQWKVEQVESVTVSFCSVETLAQHLRDFSTPDAKLEFKGQPIVTLDYTPGHRCEFCA